MFTLLVTPTPTTSIIAEQLPASKVTSQKHNIENCIAPNGYACQLLSRTSLTFERTRYSPMSHHCLKFDICRTTAIFNVLEKLSCQCYPCCCFECFCLRVLSPHRCLQMPRSPPLLASPCFDIASRSLCT